MPLSVKKFTKKAMGRAKSFGKSKLFCIGRNKTGTTSLKQALSDWQYIIADQREAELLVDYYAARDFQEVANYCKAYQAFQDAPFSWPYTFVAMDQFFPGSKFILTIRSSPEAWYNSLVNFHGKMFADGQKPTTEDLKKADYRYKGYIRKAIRIVYNTPEDDPYKKDIMIRNYKQHNELVKNYFRSRPHDLLILNVENEESYPKLANFLQKKPLYDRMPWENKTQEIE